MLNSGYALPLNGLGTYSLHGEEMGRIDALDRGEKHDWYWAPFRPRGEKGLLGQGSLPDDELQHVRPGVVPHRVVLHLAGGGPSDALSRLRGRAAYMSSLPTFQAPPTSSPTTR